MLTLFTLSLWSKDFGLILDQNAGSGGLEDSGRFDYSSALIPWFSSPVCGKGNIYLSASFMADFKNDAMKIIPELLRTEFTLSFNKGECTFGRMMYNDPLGFIAAGLFDGAGVSLDLCGGSFSVGIWYTGLQYKERARITMTKAEQISYNQLDLAKEDKLNSQYLAAKLSVPLNAFVFDLGGCLELIEFSDETKIALAGVFGVSWMLPSARLSLSGRYSSGVAEDGSLTAFMPLINRVSGGNTKGKIFRAFCFYAGLSCPSAQNFFHRPCRFLFFA